jgi:hypothetical protein
MLQLILLMLSSGGAWKYMKGTCNATLLICKKDLLFYINCVVLLTLCMFCIQEKVVPTEYLLFFDMDLIICLMLEEMIR